MAAAAVPAISLGAQYFLNRGANKRTNTALDAATKGLQGAGTDLSGYGNKLAASGSPLLGEAQKSLTKAGTSYDQVGSYLSPILNGGRGAINQALAPDLAAITETYRGAGKSLESVRGAQGDVARAELNRDKAGKLALLPSMARQNAAQGVMEVGKGQAGIGATQANAAGNIFANATAAKQGATNAYGALYGGAQNQALAQQAQNNQAGGAIGSMIFDAVKSKGGKSGARGVLPNSGPAIKGYPGLPGAVSSGM